MVRERGGWLKRLQEEIVVWGGEYRVVRERGGWLKRLQE